MSHPTKYQADPATFGIPPEAADILYEIYVVEQKSMGEAVRLAKLRTGMKFSPENGHNFIRANGWKRSPQFYSKRSPWAGAQRAAHEERKAKDRAAEND